MRLLMKILVLVKVFSFILAVFFSLPGECLSGERLVRTRLDVPVGLKTPPFDVERFLYAPPGFRVSVFATGLSRPRFMAVGPDGFIYVTETGSGEVVVLPDKNGDGVADKKAVFASGLDSPHAIAFRGKEVIVAETGRLTLLTDTDTDLRADIKKVLSGDIPAGGGHSTRTVVIGPDGHFYVSNGSSCNVCIERDKKRAAVLKIPPEGGKSEIYATGLRNSVGIVFHPETGELWGVDNGRDWLGDDLPPEELNRIKGGSDYGWPYCYGDRIPDPDYGSLERCKGTVAPEVKMQAHSAPLGIGFGYGLKFGYEYEDALYIAFHGSWNRDVPTGYKLVAIPFRDGRPASDSPFDFITGWLVEGGAWGRPVFPLVGPDGALYLSDDRAGAVY